MISLKKIHIYFFFVFTGAFLFKITDITINLHSKKEVIKLAETIQILSLLIYINEKP